MHKELYRAYVTTGLGGLSGMKVSYLELIKPKPKIPDETSEEIIQRIIDGAGIEVIKTDECI